ncbi:MAG: RNA degradosome polyphosphate kinase [Chloroflexi bacterium]|nr:RNA degradosome polyphosphate kinase [Chloroflexota bacterium]
MPGSHIPSSERHTNRELSWLDFAERVLAMAGDQFLPLLERVKFLAIFASTLDEFFMVRVASLKRQQTAGVTTRSSHGMPAGEQLEAISEKIRPMMERHARLFLDDMMPALSKDRIDIVRWRDLEPPQRAEIDARFNRQVFPVVTPLAVDPGHPFPYISNRSLNLAVLVRSPDAGRVRFARVKVPPLLPRFMALDDGETFVPLEDCIAANVDKLFPGMEVLEHHTFRVTRNTDVELDDEDADDLLRALEDELRSRRFRPAVRLEIEGSMPEHVLDLLARELQVRRADVFSLPGPLDLSGLWQLYELDRADLKAEPFTPASHPALKPEENGQVDIFQVLRERDVLVHHPYHSFRTSTQRFIEQAAADPDVLAIKQTLYRTSGESPIVDALEAAAMAGKQVVVLVEIKARFDEINNIAWARHLEQAGCHVVYGVVGFKTHCKLCLVVRQEGPGLARYVHMGTGNYNPKTARDYEDFGLLTSDPELGADVSDLFNLLTGYSRQTDYRCLVVAPYGMRERIVRMIDRETENASSGGAGRIIIKCNALVDERVIDALYEASSAGVSIDLIVRSICALRAQVPGLSENIRVRSIVGRFLEHSRIFCFHNGGDDQYFIGSADLMHRNLDRRVEAMAAIKSASARTYLKEVLELALLDNYSAWVLVDDRWVRQVPAEHTSPILLQQGLIERLVH